MIKLMEPCEKCGFCCSYASGMLVEGDAERIAEKIGISVDELKEKYLEKTEKFNTTMYRPRMIREKGKPYGVCIWFKKDKGCKIHDVKPLQCRAGGCAKGSEEVYNWFCLNYCVNPDDPESIRQWASYLRDHETIPGGSLAEIVPDKEKLRKILSYEILK